MTSALAPISCGLILDVVGVAYGVRVRDLCCRQNSRALVAARRMAWTLARHLTGRPHKQLGRVMGGFHHTTLIEGVRDTEVLIERAAETAADYAVIRAAIEILAEDQADGVEDAAEIVIHGWRQIQPATKAALEASFVAALNNLQTLFERH